MSIDSSILEYICCPITKQSLDIIPNDLLNKINKLVEKNEVYRNDGDKVDQALINALITEDHLIVYPIYNDFPVLIEDYAIFMKKIK